MKHGMIMRMSADYSADIPELEKLYPDHIATVSKRHDHALEHVGASHAVIFSGMPKVAFLDDTQYPFIANPHFLSWVPLVAVPLSVIVYTPGAAPVLVYYQPHDYWHVVPGKPCGYWTESFDVRIVHTIADIAEHLPEEKDKCILIGEIGTNGPDFGIERINPTKALNMLHFARGIKTGYEIACMRLASRRGARGHIAAEAAFREGSSEFDIHRAYCGAVSHTDNELPYTNIIALNQHGAVLHYTNLDRRPPKEIHSLLIDAGARIRGYASDITRTYSFGDARFDELIDRMHDMQMRITGKIRAGVNFSELHVESHRMLAELLVEARLAVGSPDALLASGVTAAFFPHGLGHLIGVQVHDVGGHMMDESGAVLDPPSGHPFLRLTRTLTENMVLTIEPGLYAIDILLDNLRGTPAEHHVNWDAVEWLRPFGGIRIEDDVRVTADGCENLTRNAFASVDGNVST
jgi:Xaa-Pro dipeptidase